jgi:hypothetical protein
MSTRNYGKYRNALFALFARRAICVAWNQDCAGIVEQ